MVDPTQTLYGTSAVLDVNASNPFPPGTMETAQIETVDNDRAGLMLDIGVVR